MLLDATQFTTFDADAIHLASLKWNKQRTRPRLTMKDGTEYEITVPGKTVDDLKNLTLGDWKKIAEELNRILIDKGILDGSQDAPVNARALDQLMVNKTGVTWNGNTLNHTDGHNTKDRFKTIKTLSKNNIRSTGLVTPPSPPGPGAPPPPPGPGAPAAVTTTAAAIDALKKIGGVDKNLLKTIADDIVADVTNTTANDYTNRDGSILWNDLAIELTDNHTKADALFDGIDSIPDAKKAEVKEKIRAVYVANAVATVMNGIALEATTAIRALGNWKTGVQNVIIEECYQNIWTNKFQPLIADDGDLIDPVKNRLKVELTEAKIKTIIKTRLQQLQADELRRPKGQYEEYWDKAKVGAGAVKSVFNWASGLLSGNDD